MQPGSAWPCAGLPSQRPDASQIMPECQQAGLPQGRKELVLARWYLAPCGGSRTSSGAVERANSLSKNLPRETRVLLSLIPGTFVQI